MSGETDGIYVPFEGDDSAWAYVDVPDSLKGILGISDGSTDRSALYGDGAYGDSTGTDATATIDRSGEKTALYGNVGYTGNEASSGYGMGDLLKDGSSLVKNNPGLMQTMLTGVAGAYKDKTTKEMSQAQLDYLKEQQDARNKSVGSYGKTIHGKSYKG